MVGPPWELASPDARGGCRLPSTHCATDTCPSGSLLSRHQPRSAVCDRPRPALGRRLHPAHHLARHLLHRRRRRRLQSALPRLVRPGRQGDGGVADGCGLRIGLLATPVGRGPIPIAGRSRFGASVPSLLDASRSASSGSGWFSAIDWISSPRPSRQRSRVAACRCSRCVVGCERPESD